VGRGAAAERPKEDGVRAWTYLGLALVASLAIAAPTATATPHRGAISAQTRDNLVAAAHGEAFAHAKYLAYADEAQRAGHARVARLFRRTGRTEIGDHFLQLAVMAGIVNDNATNLRDAITDEGGEATTIYPGLADQAAAQGDQRAAAMWRELAGDEAVHRDNFQQALDALPTAA
jgi:rubrerythrin